MLYLEDYIELIEQLPQDLRDRFTDMRELDLKVQNTIDTLDTRVRRFFADAARKSNKPETTEEEYKSIHKCYDQALDNAEEKVSMANQIYDLVERHLRKLDQELTRFKMELEADCSGITEILERRSMVYNEDTSLDLLYNAKYNHSANNEATQRRKFGDFERLSTAALTNGSADKTFTNIYSPLGVTYPLPQSPVLPSTSSQPGTLLKTATPGQKASSLLGSKPLNTDSLKEQGRGVQASLKAMTAAQKKAEQLGNSLSMSGLLTASSSKQTSNSSSYIDVTGNNYLPTSSSSSTSSLKQSSIQNRNQKSAAGRRAQKTVASASSHSQTNIVSSEKTYPPPSLDWVPDPNEPTYCLCNQVSYGEMVGCDNPSCSIEWFHYGCVGLTDAPKGKWYCPDCQVQIKKRRIR